MRRLSESELIQVVADMERRYRQEVGAEGDGCSVESPLPRNSPASWEDSTQPKITPLSVQPTSARESGVVVLRTRPQNGNHPRIVPGNEKTITGVRHQPPSMSHLSTAHNHAVHHSAQAASLEDSENNPTVMEIPHINQSKGARHHGGANGAQQSQHAQPAGLGAGVRTSREHASLTPSHSGWLDNKPSGLSESLSFPGASASQATPNNHLQSIGSAIFNRSLTSEEIQIPSLLGTRFHLHKLLGKGRLGRMFLAKDMDFGGEYAVRLLHPWITQPEEMLEGFSAAFKQLESLRHPSIAKVFFMGPGREEHSHFYSMEYVQGQTLEALQKEQTPFKPDGQPAFAVEDAFFFFEKMCDVLSYCHKRGVVHGDLKANNIMVVEGHEGRELRLMDFGLTQIATKSRSPQLQDNQTAQFFYSSPDDQTGSKELSPLTDVFSLGVLFYRMLTGLLPAGWVISPHQVNEALPTELDMIFQKAMHPERQSRYDSVETFFSAVQAVLYPAPVELAPPPIPPEFHPKFKSSRELLASRDVNHDETSETGTELAKTKSETPTVARQLLDDAVFAESAKTGAEAEQPALFQSKGGVSIGDTEGEVLTKVSVSELALASLEKTKESPILAREIDSKASLEISWESNPSNASDSHDVLDASSVIAELLSGEFSGEFERITSGLFESHLDDDSMIFDEPSFIPEAPEKSNSAAPLARLQRSVQGQVSATSDAFVLPQVNAVRTLSSSHRVLSLNHMALVEEVVCSPDGELLLSCDEDLMIRLWDAKNWKLLHAIPKERGSVRHLCWNSSSSQFAFCSGTRTVDVWDAKTCKPLHSIDFDSDIRQLAWLSQETNLAVGCADDTIRLWDVKAKKERSSLSGYGGVGHVFAFQASCALFLSGNNFGEVRLWPLSESEGHVLLHQSEHVITSLATVQNLPLLLCGDSSGEVSFWDLSLHAQLFKTHEHQHPIFDVGINGDGTRGYSIDESGLVFVYDLTQGKALFTHQIEANHDCQSSIDPYGRWLATSCEQHVNIWKLSMEE